MRKCSKNFFNHTPLFLAKELYGSQVVNSSQIINDEFVKHIKEVLTELKNILIEKNS